jgi:hypothetical protein
MEQAMALKMSDEARAKFLAGNACRVFGID